MKDSKKYFSEFFGTFLLVFFGTGSIIFSQEFVGSIDGFGIGIVFGLTVWILVRILGKFSDCFINPAVTICFYFRKTITAKKAFWYILFQLSGGLVASFILKFIFQNNKNLGNTLPRGSNFESFLYEFFLSFVLIIVIFVTTSNVKLVKFAPFLIGFTVFLEAWLAGPICGASMNPARSFGPSIVSGNICFLWLYFLAPISGMLVGLLVYNSVKSVVFVQKN